jgi:hypothetical protein
MDFSTFKFTIDWTTLFSSLVVALLGSSGISGIIIYIWKSRI